MASDYGTQVTFSAVTLRIPETRPPHFVCTEQRQRPTEKNAGRAPGKIANPLPPIQMNTLSQLLRVLRPFRNLLWRRKNEPAQHPDYCKPFAPGRSLVTVYSPGDKLQIVALRPDSVRNFKGVVTNE